MILDAFRTMPSIEAQTIDPTWLEKLNADLQNIEAFKAPVFETITVDHEKEPEKVFIFNKKGISKRIN